MPDAELKPHWLTLLFLVFLMALGTVAEILRRIRDAFDRWLCQCEPHERWDTYVWHTHTFTFLGWRKRWLASHSVLDDGTDYRDIVRWAEMRDSDVQVRVYPAGSRIGEITDAMEKTT